MIASSYYKQENTYKIYKKVINDCQESLQTGKYIQNIFLKKGYK